MQSFTLTHEINCDLDTFWKLFLDKTFNEALFKQGLGFPRYETLELTDRENEVFRRVGVTPKIDAPAPVVKVLGASFSYTEEGTLDKSAKIFRWKSIPSTSADKVQTQGTVRAEAAGEGKVRRISDFNCEVKVFGIGGMIESALEKNLRHGWDKSAVFMNDWLKTHS